MSASNSIQNNGCRPVRIGVVAIIICYLVTASGCAWLIKPPDEDIAAKQCVSQWRGQNVTLQNFKGLLRIRIKTQTSAMSARAAIAANMPDKLRVELLSPIGQPLSSLVSNGSTISFLSAQDQKFYRINQSKTALEPIIHIPIGVDDLIEILVGRPPIPDYYAAQVTEGQNNACPVTLKDRWHNVLGLMSSDDTGRIQSMYMNGTDGSLQYEVQWSAWRRFNNFMLPGQVSALTGSGDRIDLQWDRIWTDIPVPDNIFILENPNK